MATHKSAEKAAKQSVKRRARNQAVRTEVKHVLRELKIVLAGKVASAEVPAKVVPLFNKAQSLLMKAAKRNVINKKTASRQVARLSMSIHRLAHPTPTPAAKA